MTQEEAMQSMLGLASKQTLYGLDIHPVTVSQVKHRVVLQQNGHVGGFRTAKGKLTRTWLLQLDTHQSGFVGIDYRGIKIMNSNMVVRPLLSVITLCHSYLALSFARR